MCLYPRALGKMVVVVDIFREEAFASPILRFLLCGQLL